MIKPGDQVVCVDEDGLPDTLYWKLKKDQVYTVVKAEWEPIWVQVEGVPAYFHGTRFQLVQPTQNLTPDEVAANVIMEEACRLGFHEIGAPVTLEEARRHLRTTIDELARLAVQEALNPGNQNAKLAPNLLTRPLGDQNVSS